MNKTEAIADEGAPHEAVALLESIRRIAPGVAWLVAIVVGGMVAPKADLLDATLRGGAAFLGTWALCLLGTACLGWILPGRVPGPDSAPAEATPEGSEENHEVQ